MKVRLIKESSGFGYNSKVVDWLTKSADNAGMLDTLSKGGSVDIPENVAKNIHNLVDTATGEIISKSFTLVGVNADHVKSTYLEKKEAIKSTIKADFDKIRSAGKSETKSSQVADE